MGNRLGPPGDLARRQFTRPGAASQAGRQRDLPISLNRARASILGTAVPRAQPMSVIWASSSVARRRLTLAPCGRAGRDRRAPDPPCDARQCGGLSVSELIVSGRRHPKAPRLEAARRMAVS